MASQRMSGARAIELRDASVAAAHVAAEFIRERSVDRSGLNIREKQAADFVSEVDTGAETRIG